MTRPHISQPLLENVLSFFTLMSLEDQESFLFVWDSWVRVAADMRQHLYETNAASALSTITPTTNSLNVPFVFDPEQAVYRRALAFGRIDRVDMPVPGANRFTFPSGHTEVLPPAVGDTFLFAAGGRANPADFEISAVDDGTITTLQAFAAESEPTLDYRVDRGEIPDPIFVGCAEVYAIDPSIRSVPQLSTTVGPAGYTLVEGADYVIHEGHIGFYSRTPKQHENGFAFLFAPKVVVDEERPFRNFGFPIGFKRESSAQYVRGLQALWFALWNGPTVQNVEVGASVLFGLPFTTPGVVESVVERPGGGWEVTVVGAERVTHVLPAAFPPKVSAGQSVGFEALTAGARVADYLEEPGFIELFNLQPRVAKFHTLFVIVAYQVLQDVQEQTGEVIDFEPIVGFVDRIKQARVDFHLLVEHLIQEEVRLVAEPPIVDGIVRGHAMLGPNFTNRITIDDFGSPGLAYPHGYRDDYVLEPALSGSVVSFRDSGDELTVSWDEGATKELPDKDALVGNFVLQLANSIRISGALSVGVWAGGTTVTLAKASFDHTLVKAGDVLILSGSVIPLNQEAFTIASKAVGATTFTLTFDRSATAEDGLSFVVYRFYSPASNDGDTIVLDPATLVLDGLDPDAPGSFAVWRWRRGGYAMRVDYEAQRDSGRFDFSTRDTRSIFDFDSDAIMVVDRVRITVLDQAGGTVQIYDQRDEDGDLPGITTPAPTTLPPTTLGPTLPPTTLGPTPAPATVQPSTLPPTTLESSTPVPTTAVPTTPIPIALLKYSGNPVFGDELPKDSWDEERLYVSVANEGGTLKMWYSAADTSGVLSTNYATSVDGITWTKPNLGLFGSTNLLMATGNKISSVSQAQDGSYVGAGEVIGGTNGVFVCTSADGINGWANVQTLVSAPFGASYREGRSVLQLPDGRWLFYCIGGHPSQTRSIYVFRSQTSDVTGTWDNLGLILAANGQDEQRYSINAWWDGVEYKAIIGLFNKTDETIVGQLWSSPDALTWTIVDANYIPLGDPGEWDDEIIWADREITFDGERRIYYTGAPEDHATFPRGSTVGFATIAGDPPTTQVPTTPVPTTLGPTAAPTTAAPTTAAPTTAEPPLPSDSFNRADTSDIDGSTLSDGFHTWNQITGQIGISSNQANVSSAQTVAYEVSSYAAPDDVNVEFGHVSDRFGVFARMDSTFENGYMMYRENNGQLQLLVRTGGSNSLLQQAPVSAGGTLRLECIGTAIKVYRNDVQILSQTNAVHASGNVGLMGLITVASQLDNFAVSPA